MFRLTQQLGANLDNLAIVALTSLEKRKINLYLLSLVSFAIKALKSILRYSDPYNCGYINEIEVRFWLGDRHFYLCHPGPRFDIKTVMLDISFHHEIKTVSWPSYLYNDNIGCAGA